MIGVPGSYCEARNVPASRVVKIPAGISDEQAAVLMLKGLTACYLLRHTYRVRRGDVIVVHAAAGGVGALLAQWGRALGARVIGVVGSEDKASSRRRMAASTFSIRGRDDIAARREETLEGAGRARGLRRRWQGHLRRIARFAAQARPDGEFWQRVRAGATVLARRTRQARFAVRHAADAVRLHGGAAPISRTWRARPSRR